jgi:hypothetical protein
MTGIYTSVKFTETNSLGDVSASSSHYINSLTGGRVSLRWVMYSGTSSKFQFPEGLPEIEISEFNLRLDFGDMNWRTKRLRLKSPREARGRLDKTSQTLDSSKANGLLSPLDGIPDRMCPWFLFEIFKKKRGGEWKKKIT